MRRLEEFTTSASASRSSGPSGQMQEQLIVADHFIIH
jgi:hypothetical protein